MNTQRTRDLNLAGHRVAKGISLGWIESSTKIGSHFLQAIESEQFEKLPGGVYAISYLRQYARAAGFDESVLAARIPRPHGSGSSPRTRFAEGQIFAMAAGVFGPPRLIRQRSRRKRLFHHGDRR